MNLNKENDEVYFDVVETSSDNFRGLKSPSKLKPMSSVMLLKRKKLSGQIGEMPSSYETTQDFDLTEGDDNMPKFNRGALTNGSPQEELLSNYTQA
jgi:hypothetical protein